MTLKYLVGPVSAGGAARQWRGPREHGECRLFNAAGDLDLRVGPGDGWDDVLARLPADWRPDAVFLDLAYASVPPRLWAAQVPLVGLAADWNFLWHVYRRVLPWCDLVLTDAPGAEALKRQGLDHARAAVLYGPEQAFLGLPLDGTKRDIDVLFVGNLHPAVQRGRLPWLGRLARLAERRHVVIRTGVFDDDYRALLQRARIVFNHSVRGECNRRAFEAAAGGALLFQDRAAAGEVAAFFRDRRECVFYGEDDLEALLEHYLEREEERGEIARAGHARVQGLGFEALWQQTLAGLEPEWPAVVERAAGCQGPAGEDLLLARVEQALSDARGLDPALVPDLEAALAARPGRGALANALGLALALAGRENGRLTARGAEAAAGCFRRALAADPRNALFALNLVETLAALGRKDLAAEGARRALALLDQGGGLGPEALGAVHYPPGFDHFRVEWERASWENAGRPAAEAESKRRLLRWRLHTLLGELTGDLVHCHEAALERPDLAPSRAALGGALARLVRPREAVRHLRLAVEANPFDAAAARALLQALVDAGEPEGARRLAQERRLLARAAPHLHVEGWFAEPPPSAGALASLIVLCCNEVEYTKLCLESVLKRTRKPYELLLIDNGSADGTPAYLEEVRTRQGPERVEVVRNEKNLGFPAGCNQGLARARGEYVVLLNNDAVVTEDWLEGLVRWALFDWPRLGLVGAVTNYAPPPQKVEVDYADLGGLEAFAARRRREFGGKAVPYGRLSGFCLLARRDVLARVGGLDERYGLGFFDDDDLSLRVRQAGYQPVIAQDVFVHHFGSRTFQALGVDCEKQLLENFGRFKEKWGPEHAAGYRLADAAGRPPAPAGAATKPATAPPAPAGTGRQRVSICLIVKDEERNLPDCLGSVAGLADEVVVVDTGSSDKTREVALRLGAKVFDFPWVDDFAAARNETLRYAAGAWVFWMDADDRLDPANREKLRALFASLKDENAAYAMKCLCLPDPVSGVSTMVDHLRLFRNRPDVRWEHRVHEQILGAVRRSGAEVRWADVVVHHVGYQDPALRGRKLERDLRLLNLELAERPDHPFTLFNLGSVYQELGRPAEALPLLRKSLEGSHPADSIVRKLYALVAQCHRQQGQNDQALAACAEGRVHYPDDVELLFVEALVRDDRGDPAGAVSCLERLLGTKPGAHFASVDAGLRGYKTRRLLASVLRRQGRAAEAEEQWRLVVAERPDHAPAWVALGELALDRKGWDDLEAAAARLEGRAATDAAVLRGRGLLAREDFAAARALLEAAAAAHPRDPWPRVILSHVLLQEGKDPDAAERVLREVLALDPNHAQARHNLGLLLAERERRGADAAFREDVTLAQLYEAACRTPSDIHEHLPTLHALAKECRHVTEMGVRTGVSTTALLYAQPERLVCYDRVKQPEVDRLLALAGKTDMTFHEKDVLDADVEPTDLLFIDTWHVYDQLREELRLHAGKARKYVVLHDTTTFGERGEAEGRRGLWPAVEEFLKLGTFRIKERFTHNNGLTVLEAVGKAGDGEAPPARAEAPPPIPVVNAPDAASRNGTAPSQAPAPRLAVLCIVHDEEELIDAFLDHYFGQGADAVLLLDNDCSDQTVARALRRPNVTVAPLDTGGVLDEEARTAAFQRLRESCAGKFDWVVLADADEFLVPKEGASLKEALSHYPQAKVLGAEGWDVVQRPGEPPLEWSAPPLAQRRFGVPNPDFDKPVVLRPGGPERLAPGQHYLLGPEPRPALRPFRLLHLAGCDERLFLKRRLKMTARQGPRNVQRGYSAQHTAQTEADVRRRWRALQGNPGLVPLPACRMRDAPAAG